MLDTLTLALRASRLRGTIACPPSKSYTHRALFAASLAGGESEVRGALDSLDTRSTAAACAAFGASVSGMGGPVAVVGGRPPPRPAEIDAGNSGTTIRMAAAIAATAGGTSRLTGDSSLRSRPMTPLLDALESLGAECESAGGTPPMSVRGPVTGGRASVSGGQSSQFTSALLLAAPLMRGGLDLTIEGRAVSLPYVDATVSVMRRFGARVDERVPHASYSVAQRAYSPASMAIPSDYSSAALLLAASVLTGGSLSVAVDGAGLPQGDAAFAGMLRSMGVGVSDSRGTVSVEPPAELRGGSFCLSDAPDLLPPLAILSLRCRERIEITGVAHARAKETDRVAVMAEQLGRLGVRASQGDGSLLLWQEAGSEPRGAALDPHGDHRVFMALCAAGLAVGRTTVAGEASASVSYPRFVGDLRACGALIGEA